jgi:hypothetical protein
MRHLNPALEALSAVAALPAAACSVESARHSALARPVDARVTLYPVPGATPVCSARVASSCNWCSRLRPCKLVWFSGERYGRGCG